MRVSIATSDTRHGNVNARRTPSRMRWYLVFDELRVRIAYIDFYEHDFYIVEKGLEVMVIGHTGACVNGI